MKKQRVKHYLPIGYVQERLTVLTEAYSVGVSSTATKRCVDCISETFLSSSVKMDCHYCGKPPSKPHRKCETFLYNGLDRVDNNIGYTESNVVPCCYICNKMKGELPVEDFLEHLNKIFTRIA